MKLIAIIIICVSLTSLKLFADIRKDTIRLKDSTVEINNDPQLDSRIVIHEIRILGNRKTKKETILREIKFDKYNSISIEELKYFEKRILSLGIFSDVRLVLSNEQSKNVLIILVQESWYVWPLPFIDISDRDWKKITYGLNLNIQNLSGRNEVLTSGVSLGYDPKFYISYYNPIIDYDNDISINLKTQIQRRKNRSIRSILIDNKNYDEKYFSFQAGIGKRIDIYNLIHSSFSFEYLQVQEYFPLRTISDHGIDKFLSVRLAYSYDSRDLTAYPESGSNFNFSYIKVGLGESSVDYNIFVLETKKIFSLKLPILYLRNLTRVIAGPMIPYYANSFLGYQERIRGNFNTIYESNSLTFSNIELRFPILKHYSFSLNLPYIPSELLRYMISIDFHTFFDNAFLFDKNQKLNSMKAINGMGFGFSILFLPYRSVNLEFAWNQLNQFQFIFDLNAPF